VHPFPGRETVTVPFVVPHLSAVTLGIYDAAGRKVRSLLDDVLDPGDHAVTWDGRDDLSHRVASGTYFVRLAWPDGSSVAKASFIR
jgi:flagellar hook assembly protein FlgD